MAQIIEDYCSFETAKLLKEKGFDVYVSSFYDDEGKFNRKEADWNWNIGPRYSAPTLQMAMKWLREAFKLHCQITYTLLVSGWIYDIHNLNKDEWWVTTFGNTDTYNTYEEACEAAIKYCLENLI